MSPPNSCWTEYAGQHLLLADVRSCGFIMSFLVRVTFSFVYRESSCRQDGCIPQGFHTLVSGVKGAALLNCLRGTGDLPAKTIDASLIDGTKAVLFMEDPQ
jgi:hypothetical protein